jgi:diamine N-acetyltransferase
VLTLRPVDESNKTELEALRTSPAQERFVSTVADSLLEAIEAAECRAIAWGIYDGETPVGFVMIADEVDSSECIPHFLWKLLIDERHQRRGYGTATLDLLVEYFRERPGVTEIRTSAGQGEGSPIPFYERYGFVRTGDIVFDDEVLLRLDLGDHATGS